MHRDERGLRGGWADFQRHARYEPAPDLGYFVSHYWVVDWDLRGERPYPQPILPYPQVHLSFMDNKAMVSGVATGHVVKVLSGAGRVFGVAFRPGGFRPFLDTPVATLTDRSVPARALLGREPELPRDPDHRAMADTVEEFLRTLAPRRDPAVAEAAAAVTHIAADPATTTVAGLARDLGTGVRRLQRLFADYVGVGPKWVIRRYRLHEVTQRMAEGTAIDWAGLAADLGYADQAHLIRDFAGLTGETPAQYAQRYPLS